MKPFVILTPVYNPNNLFINLVENLRQHFPIVIVNDGSDNDELFKRFKNQTGIHIETHTKNEGKGAALKTGMMYIHQNMKCKGFITVDGDGQHQLEDILKVAQALEENPHSVILGSRSFERSKMTLRSYIGNTLTQLIFKKLFKTNIADTQTGLRGFPFEKIEQMLTIPYSGYEFEISVLTSLALKKDSIINVSIQTIYIDNNKSSHFNPFIDSIKIYFVLFRFLLVGGICFLIDNLLFFFVSYFTHSTFVAVFIARIVSVSLNLYANKKFTFKNTAQSPQIYLKYFALALFNWIIVSYGIDTIQSLFHFTRLEGQPLDKVFIKIPLDILITFVNFFIQKRFIFKND